MFLVNVIKECLDKIIYDGKPFKFVTSTKYQIDNTRYLYKCVMESIFFLHKHLEDKK